eukprot:794291-Ditylum_brightwellii.AAC.1
MIVEDMAQIAEYSFPKRYSVRGVVVHGCGTRRGQRFEVGQTAFNHEDALLAVNESLTSSQNTWMDNQEAQ